MSSAVTHVRMDVPEAEEHAQKTEAFRLHVAVMGERPRGWCTGCCSNNKIRLVAEEGGFDYVADTTAGDLPYWTQTDGRDQLIVP